MKRLMALTLIGMMFAVVLASCKSSSGHCDAYGNKSACVEINKSDLPS